ncbi:MAG: Xaa-Pro peptidase family protein [Luminiphilus sp.]|jgi:Xaa-Pro dipeptidase|nr:Xaa-Pro peptidase family protein [Luminiphilus sp.]
MPDVPKRGFSIDEFIRRLAAIQSQMSAQGIGALLLTTEHDIFYFSGFLSQFWQSPTRPWYVIIPDQGRPIAVIPEIGVNAMSSEFIQDIRSWPAPHPEDDGISLLTDALLEVLSRSVSSVIGINKGSETHIRMPLNDFERLGNNLSQARPNFKMIDATPAIRAVRMIKSESEIDKIRYVAQCVSNVFDRLFLFSDIGMTDAQLFRTFTTECLSAGVDTVSYLVGGAGRHGYDDIISPPSGRRLQDADVLIFDTGCTFDGYFCDFDRNYGFGSVNDAAKRAYQAVWQATEAGLKMARPGNTCAQVFSTMHAVLEKAGAIGETVGRYGHGLGIQLTEPPSFAAWEHTVLREGMVMTLEPGMFYRPGKMIVHEENIVIRKAGPELLSRRAPPELPIKLS